MAAGISVCWLGHEASSISKHMRTLPTFGCAAQYNGNFWSQKIVSIKWILHILYDLNLGVISVDESRYNGNSGGCGGCGEREELEIRAKLFLQDFDSDSAADSIEAVLRHIGTTHLDSLHVAVPAVASGTIGISAGTKGRGDDYWRRLKQFKDLWGTMESIAMKGKISSIGLGNVDAETLKLIYEGADKVKPGSVLVNLRSCCVVPEDMAECARANGLRLLTHSDPEVMLDEAALERGVGGEEKLGPDCVIRYQIMDKERGVLKDKRYIVRLKRKL